MNQEEKLYRHGDACQLDMAGSYYIKHVVAMTREKLDGKGDIAEELGYRDLFIHVLSLAIKDITWLYVNTNSEYTTKDLELARLRDSIITSLGGETNATTNKIIDSVIEIVAVNL